MKLKRQLLDHLDETHKFDVPQTMVDAEYEGIVQQIEAERKQANEEVTDEEKEELKTIAERRVRLGLVLSEIGNREKVNVSDQELQRAVIMEAQKYPGQEKMVFEFYQKNRQALEALRAPIFEEKVCELIFKDSTITEKEVSVEELMAEDDEPAEKPKKKSAAKKSAKK
jgi:trigger factor